MDNRQKSSLATLEKLLNDSKSFIERKPDDKLSETLSGRNYYIYDFKLADKKDSLTRQDQEIVKLRIIEPIDHNRSRIKELPSLLYIRYANGTRETLQIHPDKIDALRSPEFFENRINMYARAEAPMLDWDEGISEHYDSETFKVYEQLGTLIKDNILAHTSPQKKYNLVDIGCGNGSFLLKYIAPIPNINWIGIDLSEKNILKARAKAGHLAEDRFIFDNMLNVNSVIEKAIENKQLDPTLPFIVTSLGSITRLVLPNGFIAAKALQELYKIKGLKMIYGGGVGDPLVTKHIAKRIGFTLDIADVEKNQYFQLEKLEQKEIIRNKIAKINKSQLLDLSLSPITEMLLENPDILSAIEKSEKPITIDLSFTQLNEKILSALFELMQHNIKGAIKLRYFDNDTDQIIRFKEKFSEYKAHIETYLTKDSEDIILMAPRKFFESATPHFDSSDTNISTLKKNNQFTLKNIYHLYDKMSPIQFKEMIKDSFLHDIQNGDLDAIKKYKSLYPEWMPELLECKVLEPLPEGKTPIFLAVGRKDKEAISIIQFLLENKADVLHKGWDGETAIQEAATYGNFNIVKILREYDKETNIQPQIESVIRLMLEEYLSHCLTEKFSITELEKLLYSPDLFIKKIGKSILEDEDKKCITLRELKTDYPLSLKKVLLQILDPIMNISKKQSSNEDPDIKPYINLQNFIKQLSQFNINLINRECKKAQINFIECPTNSQQIMHELSQNVHSLSQKLSENFKFFNASDQDKFKNLKAFLKGWDESQLKKGLRP